MRRRKKEKTFQTKNGQILLLLSSLTLGSGGGGGRLRNRRGSDEKVRDSLCSRCARSCSSSGGGSGSSEPELRQPRPGPAPRREHGIEGEPLCRGAGEARGGERGGGGSRERGSSGEPSSSFVGERDGTLLSSSSSSHAGAPSASVFDTKIETDLLHDRRLGEPSVQVLLQGLPLERLVGLEDVLPARVARRARVGEDLGAEDEVAGKGGRGRRERGDGDGCQGRHELRGR